MNSTPQSETKRTSASAASLWTLILSPTIWATHFLASYLTAAVWCEKFADDSASLAPVRVAIAVYTLIAVGAIAANGWSALRRYRGASQAAPAVVDPTDDRRRFLGFATLLLACLSVVATFFVAAVALFLETCD